MPDPGEMYQRVPADPNAELGPGRYELVSTLRESDLKGLDRAGLERSLRLKYGRHIDVTDFGTQNGLELVIRVRVNPKEAAIPDPDVITTQAFWVPVILTATAIIAMLYLVWRISSELKEFVQLINDSPHGVEIARGVSLAGFGVAALGAAVLLYVWRKG